MDRMEYDWQDKLWATVIGRSPRVLHSFNHYLSEAESYQSSKWYQPLVVLILTVVMLFLIGLFWMFLATHYI